MKMTKEIHSGDFAQAISRKDLTVIKFGATWCSACTAIQPAIDNIANEMHEVEFLEMDADKNTDFVMSLGIKSLPTFGFYKSGELISLEKGLTAISLKERVKSLK